MWLPGGRSMYVWLFSTVRFKMYLIISDSDMVARVGREDQCIWHGCQAANQIWKLRMKLIQDWIKPPAPKHCQATFHRLECLREREICNALSKEAFCICPRVGECYDTAHFCAVLWKPPYVFYIWCFTFALTFVCFTLVFFNICFLYLFFHISFFKICFFCPRAIVMTLWKPRSAASRSNKHCW